jgi:hypothetical protein
MRFAMWLWCARLAWAVLPATAGSALADAIAPWPTAPARLAAVLLWTVWVGVLLALFAPRPWGLTLVRVAAPIAPTVAVLTITSTSTAAVVFAIGSTFAASVLVLRAPVARAAANALAYGDEIRFPLHIPTPLLAGPVPLAVALVATSVSLGPLLIADGRLAAGIGAVVFGAPIGLALVRSLHSLSQRWLVVVPAGVTIVDPLTLLDPVLLRREAIAALRDSPRGRVAPGVLDLRLGAVSDGIEIELAGPTGFAHRRGRRDVEIVEPTAVCVAVVGVHELRALAGQRRLPIV